MKDLVSIKELSRRDIEEILNTTKAFKEVLGRDIKKVPTLRGKTAINLFLNLQQELAHPLSLLKND